MTSQPLPGPILNYVQKHTPDALHVWEYFNAIRQIPRRTGNEAAVREYVSQWAETNGFENEADEVGNILVRVPGSSAGYDICLQAHLDMVAAVETGKNFDFATDSIELLLDGDYVTANGTSLGADNGIGVAMAMALATDSGAEHPGYELVFTVDEEVGCTGAQKLGFDLQSKYLINLDSENGDVIFNGCAGGITMSASLTAERTTPFILGYRLKVFGLPGGHSGADIHETERGNAFYISGQLLDTIRSATDVHIARIQGGPEQVRNAIPNYVEVDFSAGDFPMNHTLAGVFSKLRSQFPGFHIGVEYTSKLANNVAFDDGVSNSLIDLLSGPHSGVRKWRVPGVMPELSSNLGTITTEGDTITIGNMIRADNVKALEAMFGMLENLFSIYGFESVPRADCGGMTPWDPTDSELSRIAMRVAEGVFDEPKLQTIHAGLEAGILLANTPIREAISIGPKMSGVHSIAERVNIPSVGENYEFLKKLVADMT